jgi:hypothetical protein
MTVSIRACAGGDIESGLTHRPTDRLAAKEARGDFADPLCDEVATGVRRRPVRVWCGLRHAGALNEHDHGDRCRSGDQIERGEERQMRNVRRRETARDFARALDPDQPTRVERQQRWHGKRHQRGDRGNPRAAQHDHQKQRRDPDRRRDQRHVGRVGDHVEGFDHCRAALLRRTQQVCELPEDDVHSDPVRNPVSTDTETKRVKRPRRSRPAAIRPCWRTARRRD